MREDGQCLKPKTKIIYRPLINKTPSDPSTILTALCDVEKICEQSGQKETVFTCDQQLYRATVDIIWNDPNRWSNWVKDGESLRPTMIPTGIDIAPPQVLQTTSCKCPSSQCNNNRCGCFKIGSKCTEVCGCHDCENLVDVADDSESEDESEQ